MAKKPLHKPRHVNVAALKRVEKLQSGQLKMSGRKKAKALQNIQILDLRRNNDVASHEVIFGSVRVLTSPPSEEVVQKNLEETKKKLVSALAGIFHPGIKLKKRRNIPYFRVDPNDPKFIIREINGTTQRGTMVHGEFVAAK